MAARHSRVTSSTIFRTRKRRPLANWSWTKSSDHRAFGRASTSIGARVPKARRRARRLRTSYRPAPGWVSIWDSMFTALAPHAVSIMQPTEFYKKFDVEFDAADPAREL